MSGDVAGYVTPRSSVVMGTVGHWRITPRAHDFSYPMLTFQLDLDELEHGQLNSHLFKYDVWSICSVRSCDYLVGSKTLREKIQEVLAQHGVGERPSRITLVTMPRYFGYVFNPVSFFLCFDGNDQIIACITQVSNTFGETHLYPLICEPSVFPVEWSFPKRFYVSPFFDTQGEYKVQVCSEGEHLDITVELYRDARLAFGARLAGTAQPLTNRNLFRALVKLPFSLLLTIPRIHIQALRLFFGRKLSPFPKPAGAGPYTIRVRQNMLHRVRLALLAAFRAVREKRSCGASIKNDKGHQ